jgi:pimeloyl-ACP methyl ester carboxylesterase
VYSSWLFVALRAFFAALSIAAPGTAGHIAVHLFCTPRRHHRPGWEKQIGARGETLRVGANLAAHSWGAGPIVLLVHGWEGRGTQLGRFVDPLVAAGFRAVAVDSPAHGDSGGTRTDLIECTEALRKVARELGPLAGVIAHSFGGAVTTLALERGLEASSVVLIGAPSSVEDVVRRFGELTGLRGRGMRAFRDALERQTRVKLTEVEIFERVGGLHVPALIVHDRDDREVPFHDAERLVAQWPGATLMATEALGHRRILKDDAVIRKVTEFLGSYCARGTEPEPGTRTLEPGTWNPEPTTRSVGSA